jgi:hypothetical protein
VERHVYLQTVVSVSQHYKNPSQRAGFRTKQISSSFHQNVTRSFPHLELNNNHSVTHSIYSIGEHIVPSNTVEIKVGSVFTRGVTIHFFHKRYISRHLICITIRITIRFIGNCSYSLKSMLVDMGAAMFFYMRSLTY